ncbi:huntingtin-interacting protein K-like [Haliotis rubra]|uniref:huntingtin-interacting protein K-like n=1 Tax=Haliotis rufescens TaxID=6454 RepID=UPI001EAFB666|nr:huntingtin-interacting protein K-like [Haliotis rufescens]XP_046545032.1 huntingtin-interacting protein K-like [Haliotis rubra]
MATEEENVEIEENEDKKEGKSKKVAKHDSGAADLEKVTDYVEETEISAQSISDAMRVVNVSKAKEASERQERERELSKVKINKDDVDLIVNEIEIGRIQAERVLREHKGNIVEALVALTN